MSTRRILLSIATVAASLVTLALLAPSVVPHAGTDDPGTAGAAALRASIDPDTGELAIGVSDLDAAAKADADLSHMLSKSTAGLTPVHHPDGRVSVTLDGRFMSASLARLDPDGPVETLCTEDADAARTFLEAEPERDAQGREVR